MAVHAPTAAAQATKLDRRELAIATAVLVPVALLIVRCQLALCSRTYFDTLDQYLRGAMEPVFGARVLMRLLIPIMWSVAPTLWLPEDANLLLQILAAGTGLVGCYAFARAYLTRSEALASALLCALWLLWGMLPMGFSMAYPYDLPALAFSSLGMLALLRNDFWGLVLLVGLGTLNKETMLWLVTSAFAREWIAPRSAGGRLRVLGLFGAFSIAYLVPRLVMGSLSGRFPVTVSLYEDPVARISRVEANLRELLTLAHGSLTENVYWYALLFLPVFALWRRLDASLRALWLGAGFLVATNLVLGNIWEVRIFNELLPLASTTCFLLVRVLWERSSQDPLSP